jgi:hypothetical protein
MKIITVVFLLLSFSSYSQKAKLTYELYINPAFTKTWIPDNFYPPFSSSTYTLIFSKGGDPDIGIIGYNYGVSVGVLIREKKEFQLSFSKSLKGQRNSRRYNLNRTMYDFGKYTEYSDELSLGIRLLNRSILGINKFNYWFGVILSHYSIMIAGQYVNNNTFWNDPFIQSRVEIVDPSFTIFRVGISTELEYQLLNDKHFTFIIGLKLNQYLGAFNPTSSELAGRPRGYALSIGPSFKLNYRM